MKKTLIILIILFSGLKTYSQEKPKLVVGIVVDQMRYDYIYRFGKILEMMGSKN